MSSRHLIPNEWGSSYGAVCLEVELLTRCERWQRIPGNAAGEVKGQGVKIRVSAVSRMFHGAEIPIIPYRAGCPQQKHSGKHRTKQTCITELNTRRADTQTPGCTYVLFHTHMAQGKRLASVGREQKPACHYFLLHTGRRVQNTGPEGILGLGWSGSSPREVSNGCGYAGARIRRC